VSLAGSGVVVRPGDRTQGEFLRQGHERLIADEVRRGYEKDGSARHPSCDLARSFPTMTSLARTLVLLAVLSFVVRPALAAEPADSTGAVENADAQEPEGGFFSRFKDPSDGRLDVTAGSTGGTSGFVPVVVPSNDPALGAGLLAAIVYFHPNKLPPEVASENPPTMTGAGVGATDKESWGIAGLHSAVWSGGRTRYLGAIGAASVNLDYYGTESLDLSDNPVRFNIEGGVLVQQTLFRVADSHVFAGLRYMLLSADVTFDVAPSFPIAGGRTKDAGLAALLDSDTRDNTFTPNEGRSTSLALSYFSESFGGDFDYAKLNASDLQYWQLFEQRLTLGLRLEYAFAEDEAPFYSLPWVSLRGIPILRYLGNHVVTAEVEPRWKIDERWSLLAFGGVGRAAEELDGLVDAEAAYNYGAGFRYLLSRRLGLAGGIDLARGPDETVVYLTFGNAWGL
jgi:Omp85 superfamily domain